MLRLKEILKEQNKTQKWLSEELGITFSALKLRKKNPTYNSIKQMADVLGVTVHQLLEAPKGYSHFYDDVTGKWLGLREK